MDYQEAYDFIQSFTDYEKATNYLYSPENFDLRRVEALLSHLGNAHLQVKTVHIAGSKGKGSTAAMVASILRQAGYRTGLFTSPHLLDFRERMRVDDELIRPEEMAELVTAMAPYVKAVHETATFGRLTTFELITALAFTYFVRQRADIQVIETGLGGRLDATNVVDPLVSVITSISLDHQAILGDTIEKIATEKAGIIKTGRPVISSPQVEDARRVIELTCAARRAPLTMVGRDLSWSEGRREGDGQRFSIESSRRRYDLWLPLLGAHQRENAGTAIGAVEALREYGVEISDESILGGLQQVVWPGRLQIFARQPTVVLDGAHNAESSRRLVSALRENFAFGRLSVVLGTSSDKDIEGILTHLLPAADRIVVTRSSHPRAASTETLIARCAQFGRKAIPAGDVGEALRIAREVAREDDLICVTGSLFVVADAMVACQAQ